MLFAGPIVTTCSTLITTEMKQGNLFANNKVKTGKNTLNKPVCNHCGEALCWYMKSNKDCKNNKINEK